MRLFLLVLAFVASMAGVASAQSPPPKPTFSTQITGYTTAPTLPKSDAEWRRSSIFSEMGKQGQSIPNVDLKNFGLGVEHPKGSPIPKTRFPTRLASPYAELPPDKDPTCKRGNCEQVCTTDKDGNERCTTKCSYTCN